MYDFWSVPTRFDGFFSKYASCAVLLKNWAFLFDEVISRKKLGVSNLLIFSLFTTRLRNIQFHGKIKQSYFYYIALILYKFWFDEFFSQMFSSQRMNWQILREINVWYKIAFTNIFQLKENFQFFYMFWKSLVKIKKKQGMILIYVVICHISTLIYFRNSGFTLIITSV